MRRAGRLAAWSGHDVSSSMSTASTRLILNAIPRDAGLERLVQGPTWVVATVNGTGSRRAAGMAGVPHGLRDRCCAPRRLAESATSSPGDADFPDARAADLRFDPDRTSVSEWVELLESSDHGEAAVGLAVCNALLALDPAPAADLDGVAWLLDRAAGRSVAVVGHFPFADRRLRSIARDVWILEREPVEGEYGGDDASAILGRADIAVITGSAVANHTLDALLGAVAPGTPVLLLGPSTPLLPALFERGIRALGGMRIEDPDAVAAGIAAGESFRTMAGLRRVTLLA